MRRGLLILLMLCQAHAWAQDIVAGLDFDTFFDNREYAPCDNQESGTQFSACLSPWAGVQWQGGNRLVAGVCMKRHFGAGDKFLNDVSPIVFYQYSDSTWLAHLGIFDRTRMLGHISDAFYDERHAYEDDHIMGVHTAYKRKDGHVEIAVDWEGQPSDTEREKFRVISTAELRRKHAYCGYDIAYLHLAKDATDNPDQGVVDHMQVMPYVGLRFKAFFNFDLRATALYSYQRDRMIDRVYNCAGGMLGLCVERHGVSVAHQLYMGDSQQPMRMKYGEQLYCGNSMYGTTHKMYNKTTLRYGHRFFHDTVRLDVDFVFHHDGHALGTQQMLTLGVALDHGWRYTKH